ncbi:MAG: TetR family transcriptional regulator [Planctomycetota bacterium]
MSKNSAKRKVKRTYDAEATRKRLLEAAEEEFALKGIHGARVDNIAKKAKANKAMIYLYFKSKEGLYKEVFLSNYRKVSEQEALLELTDKDLSCITEKLLETYFDFHERNPNFWRFLSWANLIPSGNINPEELHGISGKVMGHLKELYSRGQKKRLFAGDVSFETYIFNIMSVCFFYKSNMATMKGTLDIDIDEEHNREELIKQSAKLINKGLIKNK